MLQHIHIRDLAIVSSLEIELSEGLTALTGETGAGKSILIDALGLVLGDRADSGMIRQSSDRAEITALFSLDQLPDTLSWLQERDLDQEQECILRRVLSRHGNSRAFINGSPVPLKALQELGDQLVNIHGQHAHHALLRRDHQLLLLDHYAAHQELLASVGDAFRQWHSCQRQLDELLSASQERAERVDLLRYQIDDLSKLQLGDNELELLAEEHRRLANMDQLMALCSQTLTLLDDEGQGVQPRLSQAGTSLTELAGLDPDQRESLELVESATIQVQEAISNLSHYTDRLELDPQRLQQLDRRLAECHEMARKYRCPPEQLLPHLAELEQELEQLEQSDTQLDNLKQKTESLKTDYLGLTQQLSKRRQEAAERLGGEVSQGMQSLAMPNGSFALALEQLPDDKATELGMDRVEFQVCTNPGEPAKALSKIASGGELSRISLAIQVATASCSQIPTLIFDEVDVGIGGGTAEIVGRLLRQIGETRQVLCVTHLPQVAAQAHQHLLVSKQSADDQTHTQLNDIRGEARLNEVARMLGGLEMTEQTLAHAQEMLESSV